MSRADAVHDPYQALRYPQYRLYLLANQAMFWAYQIASLFLGALLYERTASAWPLALVGLANYLPIFLFTLPAGVLADDPRRQLYLRFTISAQFLALAGLAYAVHVHAPLWAVYALVFAWSSARSVQTPLAVAFYPTLIPQDAIANSVSWNSSNFMISAVLGPVVGGALAETLGAEKAIAFATLGPLFYFCVLLMIKPIRQMETRPNQDGIIQRVLGGWEYLKTEKAIRWALTLDLIAALFGGCDALLPIFQKDILHVGLFALGWLRAAIFLGSLLMSLWLAHKPLQNAGRSMFLAVGGFGLCMIVFALSHSFALSFLALFIAGVLDGVSVNVRQTLVQVRTPEHLRGRVQAVNFMFIGSSNELGEVESASLAGLVGPVFSVLFGGIITVGVVAWIYRIAPELRLLGRLDRRHDELPAPVTAKDLETSETSSGGPHEAP